MPYKSDDIKLLLPAMQVKVQALLDVLTAQGFKPVLFDGMRTAAEAAKNAAKGAGVIDSMHLYGAAADLICADHGWNCDKHGCKFFKALVPAAEELGFVSGYYFRKVDTCHVQGLRVSDQQRMRDLGKGPENATKRNAIVAAFFARKR